MSLYALNSYSSNNVYSTLLSAKNSSQKTNLSNFYNQNSSSKSSASKNSILSMMKDISSADSNDDLQTLANSIDLVRSKGFQKKMTEEYRKVFAGENSSTKAKTNEKALSNAAQNLGSSAAAFLSDELDFNSDSSKLLENAKDFVSDYNKTLDGLKNTESNSALQKGVSLVSTTAAYSKSLEKIGITVGKDNKLSIDDEKFSNANAYLKKSLLSGRYSYANKTAEKAGAIQRAAQIQSQSAYNNLGQARGSSLQGAMIDSMFSNIF